VNKKKNKQIVQMSPHNLTIKESSEHSKQIIKETPHNRAISPKREEFIKTLEKLFKNMNNIKTMGQVI
jgi:hypothetical protein